MYNFMKDYSCDSFYDCYFALSKETIAALKPRSPEELVKSLKDSEESVQRQLKNIKKAQRITRKTLDVEVTI